MALVGIALVALSAFAPSKSGELEFYLPLLAFMKERIQAGELPLWNPFFNGGFPQVALLSPSFLYPPYWIFAFLPQTFASFIFVGVHSICSLLAVYLLSKNWFSSRKMRVGMSLCYCLIPVFSLGNYAIVAGATWLPWVMLSSWCLTRKEIDQSDLPRFSRTCGRLAFGVLSIALVILAGSPLCVVLSLISSVGIVLLSGKESDLPRKLRFGFLGSLFVGAIVMVLAILVCAPLLLPHFELTEKRNLLPGERKPTLGSKAEESRFSLASDWTWNSHASSVPSELVVLKDTFNGPDEERMGKFLETWYAGHASPPREPEPHKKPGKDAGGPRALESPKLEVMVDEPTHQSLSVYAPEPCFLHSRDYFYPGWHATVDGQPVRCYRAGNSGRAVFIEPGSHLIEFDFAPESFRLGVNIFFGAVSVVFVLLCIYSYPYAVKTVHWLSYGVWE